LTGHKKAAFVTVAGAARCFGTYSIGLKAAFRQAFFNVSVSGLKP
jgi:hypothetical protein